MNYFSELITMLNGGHVYIRTHNFPDPDAIASAYGLQYLLKQHNISSAICFSGQIDRFNTRKMLDLLQIQFVNVEELDCICENDHIIFIDAQYANANVQKENHLAKLYCIDHHPVYEQSDYVLSDIRPEYGACATIIGQYFLENHIPFTRETATALIYGLKIDTANLSRGVSQADLDTFYQLYSNCDLELLQSLEHNTMMLSDLKAYGTAIASLNIHNDYCFADAGSNCQEALIATICDFLISLADIELSIVYSIKEYGIKISVRSSSNKYDSGEICNLALQGIGNGGGHSRMAGGFIPLTDSDSVNLEIIQNLIIRFENAIHS